MRNELFKKAYSKGLRQLYFKSSRDRRITWSNHVVVEKRFESKFQVKRSYCQMQFYMMNNMTFIDTIPLRPLSIGLKCHISFLPFPHRHYCRLYCNFTVTFDLFLFENASVAVSKCNIASVRLGSFF